MINTNVPYQNCFVRNSFLFNDETNRKLTECYIFGAKAIMNRPIGFHCQLNNGAVFFSLPISAFVHKKDFEFMGDDETERISLLSWWDTQGEFIFSNVFTYLEGYRVDCKSRDKKWRSGVYLFTLDDLSVNGIGYATSNDSDSKTHHFIKLDNGNYCLMPNNYLRWHNANFVTPYDLDNPPKYHRNVFDLRSENDK
jgi:hypothetical protein